jgi:oxygen-independent coproporphyrinogen-3 oxidase
MPPISIYIHWPFCLSLCPYCDFNSHISSSIDHELWLSSYKKEINHFKDKIEGRKIQSIFFGGGPPSLMNPRVVEGVIQELSNIGILSSDTEITLEANPTSYET